jgi:hypothetical protein
VLRVTGYALAVLFLRERSIAQDPSQQLQGRDAGEAIVRIDDRQRTAA